MDKFKDLGRSMGGFRCVTIKTYDKQGLVDYQDLISGEKGDIWNNDSDTYKAMFVSKYEVEKIIAFKNKDISKWIIKLKVPPAPSQQLVYANDINIRHERLKIDRS